MVLKAEGIHKSYIQGGERLHILKGLSLELEKNSFVALLGASGSGKSTLLHILGLLDAPSEGAVTLLGHSTQGMNEDQKAKLRLEHIGFVFQFHHLIPELSALENVTLPASMLGRKKGNFDAAELLDWMGLKDRQNSFPWQLSGGEQQRVALSRALINSPELLLTDEVTGNLDKGRSLEVFELLRRIHKEFGTAVLSVTHDEHLAGKYDQRWRLEDGLLAPEKA